MKKLIHCVSDYQCHSEADVLAEESFMIDPSDAPQDDNKRFNF